MRERESRESESGERERKEKKRKRKAEDTSSFAQYLSRVHHDQQFHTPLEKCCFRNAQQERERVSFRGGGMRFKKPTPSPYRRSETSKFVTIDNQNKKEIFFFIIKDRDLFKFFSFRMTLSLLLSLHLSSKMVFRTYAPPMKQSMRYV